jgi:hypothetical protein
MVDKKLISGFTFVRNATKYYFPIKQSILSILPIVDEFIVALGLGDEDDITESEILSINSEKIKVIRRVWDESLFKGGEIYRHETNFAKSQCSGEWLFYIQADEVFHEKYLQVVKEACNKYLSEKKVEGFLFRYRHFWGDFDHVVDFHGWYNREIRIIRNASEIVSVVDAQSFRKADGSKLDVILLPVEMYHYGWVRPPCLMRAKKKEQDSQYWGKQKAEEVYSQKEVEFDYGALGKIPLFIGSHPKVLSQWISGLFWKGQLNYSKNALLKRELFKHEKPLYRFITRIEKAIGGKQYFSYRNWKVIGKYNS